MRIKKKNEIEKKRLLILSLLMIIAGITLGILLISFTPFACKDTLSPASCVYLLYVLPFSSIFVILGLIILIGSKKR
jgi:hypothetical protein